MHRTIVTAGHVDHGKSSLVRALTGMEPDRLEEERRRGLTIDLGYAWVTLPDGPTVAFVDVPGHERLVQTMLAGAGTAPAALFVVAADDGWKAQSSEHRDVLDLLGIPVLAVAVTKTDRVDATRLEQVIGRIAEATDGTTVGSAPLVPVDSVTGAGLDRLRAVLSSGAVALPDPSALGRPRLWVDRTFVARGSGTVATGTLTGGHLDTGDHLTLLPAGQQVRVRGLQALGTSVPAAAPGMRVAVQLAGVSDVPLARGDALVGAGPWTTSNHVDVWLRVLPGQQVQRTGAWRLHAGTAAVVARLQPVVAPIDGAGEGAVRLHLDRPLPLVTGDRVVLREVGRATTVAGGRVADPAPGPLPRGRPARQRHAAAVQALSRTPPDASRLTALLAARRRGWLLFETALGAAGLPTGLPVADAAAWADPPPAGTSGRFGGLLVASDTWSRWQHALRALGPGPHERERVTGSLVAAGGPTDAGLVDELIRVGRLVRVGGGLALADAASGAIRAADDRASRLLGDLLAEPFAPPPLADLATRHGVDHRLLTALVNRGTIVRCGPVAFAAVAVPEALRRLVRLESTAGPFTAAQARTAWETTRRFAIPLLEHLDGLGATAFDGRLRTVTELGRRAAAAPSAQAATDQSPTGPS